MGEAVELKAPAVTATSAMCSSSLSEEDSGFASSETAPHRDYVSQILFYPSNPVDKKIKISKKPRTVNTWTEEKEPKEPKMVSVTLDLVVGMTIDEIFRVSDHPFMSYQILPDWSFVKTSKKILIWSSPIRSNTLARICKGIT